MREVEPGFVDVVQIESVRFEEPEQSDTRLIGPHFALQIGAVAVAPSFSDLAANSDREDFRAPDGHELLATVFEFDPRLRTDLIEDGPTSARIEVGGESVQLDAMPQAGDTILVAVPEGESASLVVIDTGRTQSIDLRTGERGDDAIEDFYSSTRDEREQTYTGSGSMLDYLSLVPTSVPADVEITVVAARREKWLPSAGYADDDRAWLAVSSHLRWESPLPILCNMLGLRAELILTLVDGAGHEVQPAPAVVGPILDSVAVFDVPATFARGTLRIDPGASGFVTTGYGPPTQSMACSWTTPPAPDTLSIHLTTR